MASDRISVLCVIRGREGSVEGLCLDFDLAVHGRSYEEVERRLEHAIKTYIEDVSLEDEANRVRLLNRRAPLSTRFGLLLSFLWNGILRQDGADTYSASRRHCPA